MSDTPKTDFVVLNRRDGWQVSYHELKEHARQLERRYTAIKRQALQHIDSADDYGYEAEAFDKRCDELAEWYRKFDNNELGKS